MRVAIVIEVVRGSTRTIAPVSTCVNERSFPRLSSLRHGLAPHPFKLTRLQQFGVFSARYLFLRLLSLDSTVWYNPQTKIKSVWNGHIVSSVRDTMSGCCKSLSGENVDQDQIFKLKLRYVRINFVLACADRASAELPTFLSNQGSDLGLPTQPCIRVTRWLCTAVRAKCTKSSKTRDHKNCFCMGETSMMIILIKIHRVLLSR